MLLVTPAMADANNGNWQTANRWCKMLSQDYQVHLASASEAAEGNTPPADVLVALHARRSAQAVAEFSQAFPGRPIVLVLTGTDLYADLGSNAAARRSLKLADLLVVLHEAASADLPPSLRSKVRVCLQSSPARRRKAKPADRLRALMVGHLRSEKDPRTAFAAARLLQARMDIRLLHIGRSLEPELGQEAEALSMEDAAYGWLGELSHEETLAHMQLAHVLVHPSRMEGGAHAVIEAVRCGTPVLASRIPGNVGLLGEGYAGYFPVGDAAALAALMERARDDAGFLPQLIKQCSARSARFSPEREQAALLGILREALQLKGLRAEAPPPASARIKGKKAST